MFGRKRNSLSKKRDGRTGKRPPEKARASFSGSASGGGFDALHLRLTALCSLVTGGIILIFILVCLAVSESGLRKQEFLSFQSNITTLCQNMEHQSYLSHGWIRQMETNYQVLLRFTDNGTPLLFQSLDRGGTAERLLELAEEAAVGETGIDIRSSGAYHSLARHGEYAFRDGSGRLFFGAAALIPHSHGSIGILAVHSLTGLDSRIQRQRIGFSLAGALTFLLFLLFFWHFTAKMLRPLKENQQKQIQFVASASHELRSPLTVILSNVAAVKSGILPGDGAFLDTLESEGQRMSRLIGDMLQLAGADSHSWDIRPQATELDTLLLQIWEDFEPQAASRGLSWEIRLPEEATIPCLCDGERIRQLLAILIDNAFSYTPSGGRVCLSLAASGSAFRLSVSDDGPGIPDREKEAVFERFYRSDPARKEKSHFGLGLSIAREIALLHRGQLTVSDTPGGGATFTLTLPG